MLRSEQVRVLRYVQLGLLALSLNAAGCRRKQENSAAQTAPPPAPPPRSVPRCEVRPGTHPVGNFAELASVSLVEVGGRIGIAWIVPPLHDHGGDDSAGAELRNDGSVLRVIDPEEPRRIEGLASSPINIGRVNLVPGQGGAFGVQTDRVDGAVGEQQLISCGAVSNMANYRDETVDEENNLYLPDYRAMFFCRTVCSTGRSFVLGFRGESRGGDDIGRNASVIALRSGSIARAPAVWRVPIEARVVTAARDPVAVLRGRESPDGYDAIAIPGHGYLVALRLKGQLRIGWMTDDLRAAGELATVTTLGGEPGKPRLLSLGGTAAMLVFADRGPTTPRVRGEPSPTPPPYALYGLTMEFGAPPGRPVSLQTGAPTPGSQFSPATQTLPDGTWLLTWTQGPLDMRSDTVGRQMVYLRRYQRDFTPVDAPTLLSGAENASDARIVTMGNQFVVALMTGRSRDQRSIVTLSGQCAVGETR